MAWMRMMGANSVAYHEATVMGRADDHAGQALDYYGSRGETPLVWGGGGAARLGLNGRVTHEEYAAIYGPGGARHPRSGQRLAATRRPGMELVVSAHKSVAELGVIGRAEDMHRILDAERDATLAYLEGVTCQRGGRRGRLRFKTPTGGLVYAQTRHATSRAGDPCPHDHVLIADVVEMLDGQGGWKAADSILWRDHLHAATVAGRIAAARVAVELGYAIEADRSLRPTGPLEDRRDPRRGPRGTLEAGGGDHRRGRRPGHRQLPGPQHRRPRHPRRQAAHPARGADAPLAGRTGRGRLDRAGPRRRCRPGRRGRRTATPPQRTRSPRTSPPGTRPRERTHGRQGVQRRRHRGGRRTGPVREADRRPAPDGLPGPGRPGHGPAGGSGGRPGPRLRHRRDARHRGGHRRGSWPATRARPARPSSRPPPSKPRSGAPRWHWAGR